MSPVSNLSKLMGPFGPFRSPRLFFPWATQLESMDSSQPKTIPRETDVLVIGGGLIGQAVAFFLKREQPNVSIAVVERDPTYKKASSTLSAASFRQQFSLPENIKLSLFNTEVLKKSEEYFKVDGQDPVDMCYNHVPYLFLAETDKGASILEKNVKLQQQLGALVTLLPTAEIRKRYPWLNVDKVKLGSLGLDNEGYFDPWSLLVALKKRNIASGVRFIHGEVDGFEIAKSSIAWKYKVTGALVKDLTPKSENKIHPIGFKRAVISAGCWSGEVTKKLTERLMDDSYQVTPLPVEPRLRYCYIVHCKKGPVGQNSLMVVDPNGVYFRRDGYAEHYLVGGSPLTDADEPKIDDMTPNDDFFMETLWPLLAARAPCFEECKLTNSWCGYYDMNPVDHNLIVGPHNYFKNILFATGLSGHGVMHSLGVGRAVSELVFHGKYKTIDLSRFSFDRIVANKPLWEETML